MASSIRPQDLGFSRLSNSFASWFLCVCLLNAVHRSASCGGCNGVVAHLLNGGIHLSTAPIDKYKLVQIIVNQGQCDIDATGSFWMLNNRWKVYVEGFVTA